MNKCCGYYYDQYGKKNEFDMGTFLEWGNETDKKGHLNTVAIIKLNDGNIVTTRPRYLKFYT